MAINTNNLNIVSCTVPEEMIYTIYTQCLVHGDINDVISLASTCHRLRCLGINFISNCESTFLKSINLGKSGQQLHIIDTCAPDDLQNNCIKINLLIVIEACKPLAPLVENNGDLAFVILRKGTTLNQLCNANPQMNGVSHWEGIASALGDVAIEQTCVGLMTCNIIAETRNKSFDEQSALIKNLGCAIPTIYPYLAVCSTASSNKVYSDTYAFSSTQLEDCLLIAGFCAAYMKVFSVSGLSPNSAPSENRGAGAWLPLDCALSKKD